MLLVASHHNADHALPVGMAVLRKGGTALDAVEAAIRVVEADPNDHTVGVGGWPNLLGESELDASIMDGRTRASGAVGALRSFAHPISVARLVMERLPHVFLVGQGAADFAEEMGFAREETLTAAAAEEWIRRLQAAVPTEKLPDLLHRRAMAPWVNLTRDPQRVAGTVNVIAVDIHGDIASGVSTSGWAWKYPGRLGDSPVIGAGNYCDNRAGAAACIGHGELAIRGCTAHTVVLLMQTGMSLVEACRAAIADLPKLPGDAEGSFMALVAVDNDENHGGATNLAQFDEYIYMTSEMDAPATAKRLVVPFT